VPQFTSLDRGEANFWAPRIGTGEGNIHLGSWSGDRTEEATLTESMAWLPGSPHTRSGWNTGCVVWNTFLALTTFAALPGWFDYFLATETWCLSLLYAPQDGDLRVVLAKR
jgi:hypothetical protein